MMNQLIGCKSLHQLRNKWQIADVAERFEEKIQSHFLINGLRSASFWFLENSLDSKDTLMMHAITGVTTSTTDLSSIVSIGSSSQLLDGNSLNLLSTLLSEIWWKESISGKSSSLAGSTGVGWIPLKLVLMMLSLMIVNLWTKKSLKPLASSVSDEHLGNGLMLLLASRAFVILNTSLVLEAFSRNNTW